MTLWTFWEEVKVHFACGRDTESWGARGWTDSRIDPSEYPPLSIHSPCNPLVLSISGACDLLLANRIWYRWWNASSVHWITLDTSVTSVLLVGCLPCWLWWSELPYGEAQVARNLVASARQTARSGGPQWDSLQGTESCQQPRELGSKSFYIKPQIRPQPQLTLCSFGKDPKAEGPANLRISEPQKLWGNKCVILSLNLWWFVTQQ